MILVCGNTDHSGPYAKSISGARYSQLFLDRGSGYLWACRQKKKTECYVDTRKILFDAHSLSGRSPRIMQTDGDGVFTGGEFSKLLESEKIRHERSAPYDSDTNSFIERARRTVFEGVATALLRSGAPANFWGEAEAYKILQSMFCLRKKTLKMKVVIAPEKIFSKEIENLLIWRS